MPADVEITHYYTNRKAGVNSNNSKIIDGTIWFCEEDKSFGVKMNGNIKEFGTIGVKINNKVSNTVGILDEIRIVDNPSDINTTELLNVLYFVIGDKSSTLVMNRPLTYKP